METLSLYTAYVFVTIVGVIALVVAWLMLTGKIDLTKLVGEADGTGSMSRFQLLIFTFVVAGCLLVLTLESGEFPDVPNQVLALVGISTGGYVGAKAVSASSGATPKGGPAKDTKRKKAGAAASGDDSPSGQEEEESNQTATS